MWELEAVQVFNTQADKERLRRVVVDMMMDLHQTTTCPEEALVVVHFLRKILEREVGCDFTDIAALPKGSQTQSGGGTA